MVAPLLENIPAPAKLSKLMQEVTNGNNKEFLVDDEGVLRCQGRFYVLDVDGLRREILEEAHYSAYTIHLGATRMYHDLKRDVAEFIPNCLTHQQVKVEHQTPLGLHQQIEIPELKWERITMDFVVGLPRTLKGYDSIWSTLVHYFE